MTRHTFRSAALPAVLLLFGFAHTAHAQDVYFPNNATIDAAHPVVGEAYIGYDSTSTIPSSPTVDLVSGGSIGKGAFTYNSSILNITGGSIGDDAVANDDSTINIRGGSIGSFFGFNNGTLNFYGTGLSDTLTNPAAFGVYSQYELSGKLSDGTSVNGKSISILNDSTARFTLNNAAVPEPGSVALLGVLGLGGLSLLARRKRAA